MKKFGLLKKYKDAISNMSDKIGSVSETLGSMTDNLEKLSDAVEKVSGTIATVSDTIGNVTDTLSNKGVRDGVKELLPDSLSNLMESLEGLATGFVPQTKRIVILGTKGSGKTTLWQRLNNNNAEDGDSKNTTDFGKIGNFRIKIGGSTVKVSDTKDFGGGNEMVKYYGDIINGNGTFIIYLVDLLTLQEEGMKETIRARLQKISQIIKSKKLKDCGCKILATNLKKYRELGLEEKYGSPATCVAEAISFQKRDKLSMKVNEFISPVELTDDDDIKKIKKLLTKDE